MQREPTPEELALARRIAAPILAQLVQTRLPEMSDTGDFERAILNGHHDTTTTVQVALFAIQQTTELAAAYLEGVAAKRSDHMKVAALRRNDHLEAV